MMSKTEIELLKSVKQFLNPQKHFFMPLQQTAAFLNSYTSF